MSTVNSTASTQPMQQPAPDLFDPYRVGDWLRTKAWGEGAWVYLRISYISRIHAENSRVECQLSDGDGATTYVAASLMDPSTTDLALEYILAIMLEQDAKKSAERTAEISANLEIPATSNPAPARGSISASRAPLPVAPGDRVRGADVSLEPFIDPLSLLKKRTT